MLFRGNFNEGSNPLEAGYQEKKMKARQAKRLARTGLSISLLVVIGAGFSTISSASEVVSAILS